MPINFDEMEYLFKKNKRSIQVSELDLEEARKYFTQSMRKISVEREVYSVIEKKIYLDDGKIKIRIYHPSENSNEKPIMLFCHGGGFVMGDLESYDFDCRNFALEINCVVVLVEYRLAPEHQYPTAINDCYAVAKWILDNPKDIGGDINKYIIAGDSAGGNLAANVILKFIEAQEKQVFKLQLLMYPVIDFQRKTESHQLFGEGYNVTSKTVGWCYKQYFGDRHDLYRQSLLNVKKEYLLNFPKTLIITAEYDPLRDEGKQFYQALKKAGVGAFYKEFEGTIHGFMSMPKILDTTSHGYKFISKMTAEILN